MSSTQNQDSSQNSQNLNENRISRNQEEEVKHSSSSQGAKQYKNQNSNSQMMVEEDVNYTSQQNLEDSNQQSQGSEITQEHADSVGSLPSTNQEGDLMVLESKTICYCSNFDLDINEWFNEYENIEIFKINMKKNLGAMWLKYFNEAVQLIPSSAAQTKVKLTEDHFFTRIFNFYLVNYYSPANACAIKMTQHSEQMFEKYFRDLTQHLQSRNYKIIDANLFKSLIQTFYFVSLKEYENILKKIESDQKYQIQLTEKALAQYDQQQRREALNHRELRLDQQRQQMQGSGKNKDSGQNNQGNQGSIFGNNFPGFSIIKDRVIKPLLIATEKVVEYYFPEEKKQISSKSKEEIKSSQAAKDRQQKRSSVGVATKTTIDETLSEESNSELSKIKRKMKRLDLNSTDDNLSGKMKLESPKSHRTLKKRRFRQLERYNFDDELDPFEAIESRSKNSKNKNDRKGMKLNEKMLRKASATVDLISQKVKSKNMIQETVSASFVTNVIELTKEALEKIAQNDQTLSQEEQNQTYDMNLRFIKPSHNFYNEVMSNWFKYLYIYEEQRNETQEQGAWNALELQKSFIGFNLSLQKATGTWQDSMLRPLEFYAHIMSKEYCQLRNHCSEGIDEDDSNPHISMCTFFDHVKSNLLKRWEKDIVQKSSQFQQQQSSFE